MATRCATISILALGLALTSFARADDLSGLYLGAAFGQGKLEIEDADFDEQDQAVMAFIGYQFSDLIALEFASVDGGAPTLNVGGIGEVETKIKGVNTSMLLRARKGSAFAFFLKLGYASYDVDVIGRVNGQIVAQASETQQNVTYGLGASYLFARHFMVRLEYLALRAEDADYDLLTAGIGYKF